MDTSTFKAGAAKVDTTPPLGTIINGDFIAHFANYIHDPLYAKAIVLQKGETQVAMVTVDICVMPKDFLDDVKSRIAKQTGIPAGNALISSTHTHAAGSIRDVYLAFADLEYRKKVAACIIKAVQQAQQNARPAKIAFGAVDIPEHVLCRRYFMKDAYTPRNPVSGAVDGVKTNPFGGENLIDHSIGTTDPQATFIAIKGTDEKWISLFANYSLHYVGDWNNGTISADYFGVFGRHVQQQLNAGDDFVGIMSNGTSGDANIWDFLNPDRYPKENFKKSELIGGDIAGKLVAQLNNAEWETDPALAVQYEELAVGIRKPSPDELAKAEKVVAESDYENFKVSDQSISKLYAREQVLLNEYPDTLQFPIQAIKIGSVVVGALGGEIFAETGLWVKEKSPVKRCFTVSLANSNAGYVPPAHEIARGGYETWRSRTSHLEVNAEELIRNKLLQLINRVAGA